MGYSLLKNQPGGKIEQIQNRLKSIPFSSSKSAFKSLARFNIFAIGAKSLIKEENAPAKEKEFDLLGVVKVGKLYIVVQFKKGKKIRLFPEKSSINNKYYVEKIGIQKVLIRDDLGVVRIYNVFKLYEVINVNQKGKKKSPPSPSQKSRQQNIDNQKRSQKRNG